MSAEIRNCDFRFQCPKTWDALEATAAKDIRFCPKCRQKVYYCRTPTELQLAIVQNRCVAVEVKKSSKLKPQILLGDAIG